jgi:hypothetical protein
MLHKYTFTETLPLISVFSLFSIVTFPVIMLHKYTFTETLCLISVFSLFSIVTFPNGGCASQDASRNGTCYTSEECLEKSGTVSGNCAAGYANLNIVFSD